MIAPPKCALESAMPGAIRTNGNPLVCAVASVGSVPYEMSIVPDATADASDGVEGFCSIVTSSPFLVKNPLSCA